MSRISLMILVVNCTLIAAFSGCRSMTPPVTYYTLSSIPGQMAESETDASGVITIGIRPVELPGYINRTQMVTRSGPHQLEISSLHRWADYPDRMVQKVLGENLQALMPHARVVNATWPVGLKPDVTVSFQFLELIGISDKKMLLNAVWTVAHGDSLSVVQSHRTILSEPMPSSGFDDLAAAHSRVLEALCRAVAETLTAFQVQ
ncbi:MAG: membrane integrity-associated transporter subunit PqiC [Desulfosarcina sp.]|nr:membrane integrity-associated transporter subunit PqiC [Desulfosarcina sp.]MBC2744439.1 membrane integrity-associated transporter subunit PqiC [Desulfosarcina sp.]MBC2767347.1 membrane integrity-associated transporter subunit PqiC [Desulfosarcina sp.]